MCLDIAKKVRSGYNRWPMITKEHVLSRQGLKDQLQVLHRKNLAPSESLDPVFEYCKECEDLALERIKEVLLQQQPLHAQEINEGIEGIRSQKELALPESRLKKIEGEIMYLAPGGRLVHVPKAVEAVYFINPDLGILPYLPCFYVPQKTISIHEKYLDLSKLFTEIVEAGKIDTNSPEAKIMALVCLIEVAKDHLIGNFARWGDGQSSLGSARELAEYALIFGGVEAGKFPAYFDDRLGPKIDRLRLHQGFLRLCQRLMDDVAQGVGLKQDQVKLLKSLMSTRKRYIPGQSGFTGLITPVAEFVKDRNWPEAQKYMDFLVGSFPKTFPQWVKSGRVLQNGNGPKETSTAQKFRQIVESIVSIQELPTSEGIRRIVKTSGNFASTIVVELAMETKFVEFKRYLVSTVGKNAMPLVLDLVCSNSKFEDGFERFVQIRTKSGMNHEGIDLPGLYVRIVGRFKEAVASVIGEYRLLLPDSKAILGAELVGGNAVYWYTPVKNNYFSGNEIRLEGREKGEFGELVYRLINLACERNTHAKVLDPQQLINAFTRAYRAEVIRNSSFSSYSLCQYLSAFILDAGKDLRIKDHVSVARFLMELR